MQRCHVRSVRGFVAHLHAFCLQTHQPVFIQLLQSAFRIYNCTWPNPAQKSSVESCIRTLAEVGKSGCRVLLTLTFCERSWTFGKEPTQAALQFMTSQGKAGTVSLKPKSNAQPTVLNIVAYFWGGEDDPCVSFFKILKFIYLFLIIFLIIILHMAL